MGARSRGGGSFRIIRPPQVFQLGTLKNIKVAAGLGITFAAYFSYYYYYYYYYY
jgi:hypothetical protein